MLRKLKLLCFLVGGYKITEFGYHTFQGLQTYYLASSPDLQERYGKGNYALISDSSSQMGQEFSKALAASSQNLILLSENQIELSKLQSELKNLNPNIDIKTFELASKSEKPEDYQTLFKKLESFDIGLLVNSSEANPNSKDFEETTCENLKSEVISTLLPGTLLANQLIGRFQKRSQNSGIITIGSAFGDLGNPFYTVSAGNMGFMNYLTRSLALELDDNIDVLLVTPGPIKKQALYGHFEGFDVEGREIVGHSLNNLGGKKWIVGSPKQGILYYMMARMPKLSETMLLIKGLMNIQANK